MSGWKQALFSLEKVITLRVTRRLSVFSGKDPKSEWEDYLNKYYLLPKTTISERRQHFLVSIGIIVFLAVNAVRYFLLLFITDPKHFVLYGSVFYPLGRGGIVIYVAACMSCLQALLYRVVILLKERKDPEWNLISDLHVSSVHSKRQPKRQSPLLQDTKFEKKLKGICLIVKIATQSTNICSDLITLITTLIAISAEKDQAILWMFWFFNQCCVTYMATDMTIVCGVWYVCNISIKKQIREFLTLLELMIEGDLVIPRLLVSKYLRMRRKVTKFNDTSKKILFILAVCSSFLNASTTYAAMETKQVAFIVISITLAAQSLFLLEAATTLSTKGLQVTKKFYELLGRKSHVLTIRDKKMIHTLIADSSVHISLKDVYNERLTRISLLAYLANSVGIFLMFVEFIETH